jgi:hypothetical protein
MSEQKYFYIENGTQTGPVSAEELLGKIGPNTDIWCPGMANWAPANTVPEVAALLGGGMSAPAPDMPDPAATQYAGGSGDYSAGNSQNYGSNPNYADSQQPDFGNPQSDFGNQQSNVGIQQTSFGNQQPNFGNQQNMPSGEKPNNYLALSIVVSVLGFCWCLPLIFGIVAIVYATKVDSEWKAGHAEEARQASEKAKLFVIIAGVLIAVLFVINIISGFSSAVLQNMQ